MGARTLLAIVALVALVAGPVAPAVATVLLPSAPSPGSIGIRLLEAPAGAEDDPRAQVHIVDHVAPGSVITRRIAISSTVEAPLGAVLYPAAATITDGSFSGADGRTANDLSSWITVAPNAVEVPAGGEVVAAVTIEVPRDAAPGEQYAVVWAQVRSASADGGIDQVSRVGLRVYLSVGPGGAPAADFAIETLTAERRADGAPGVLAQVRNTGGRALDLVGTLELTEGPGGVRAGPFPAMLGTTLAIGATAPVTVALEGDLPAGPWTATITLRSGTTERTATATITFPAAGRAGAVDAAPPRSSGRIAAWIGLLATVALVTALWLTARRRDRWWPWPGPTPRSLAASGAGRRGAPGR